MLVVIARPSVHMVQYVNRCFKYRLANIHRVCQVISHVKYLGSLQSRCDTGLRTRLIGSDAGSRTQEEKP
ncbi:hypothetical protein J2Z31_004045 [Sinorhizobium kostiense]|uniref:Transposase n=1 Tax=Sinorhizobium kostiense TaxID=76747 RepID=A0ABS4R6R0_9HYPH|nr:hypothetical protein [Sinorhizobium kostiense]